jgi:hypothetical protein
MARAAQFLLHGGQLCMCLPQAVLTLRLPILHSLQNIHLRVLLSTIYNAGLNLTERGAQLVLALLRFVKRALQLPLLRFKFLNSEKE